MSHFVPLHLHSQYSILDAAASVQEIAKKAKSFGIKSVALTDHGNLYGAVDFYKACKAEGIKPIIGCEVYVAPGSRFDKTKVQGQKNAHHLILLAKNETGYHNLCKLVSKGFIEGFYYHPRIDKELLKEYKEGLICLSACLSSSIAEAALHGGLDEEITFFHKLFGEDFFLEIQRHRMSPEKLQEEGVLKEPWLERQYVEFIEAQEKVNALLIDAAKRHSIPLVATNDTHYIEREDWKVHEILLNVSSGEPCEIWEKDSLGNNKNKIPNPKRRVYSSHELYFKSPEEMEKLFEDVPEAIHNTNFIAERCQLELDFKTKHYPVYTPPEGHTAEEYLWKLCREGIPKRYTTERLAKVAECYPGKDPMKVVEDRLAYEMSIITSRGMCDYSLIVFDFINWAKTNGIPMGPGRGSGGGVIVYYLIGITDVEPLRFNLFFERFINPERLSYPDIDVDICMDRRGEVIDYVSRKYGKECVAQIITFGTMKAKMAIKDVGRVLSIPLAKVNEIAKLVPEDPSMTLDKAIELDPELSTLIEKDEEAAQVISLAKRLEGCIRNTGTHAAGVIISSDGLTNHIPICTAKDTDMPVTQYSMKPVELVGMLKIDLLGLKTLTCIQKTVDNIVKGGGPLIDWVNLSLEDKKTFELLNQGKTTGTFQLEGTGVRDLIRSLHIDRFEEIIAVTSLYRPGPMELIPSFIARKLGQEPIEIDHPWMKEILQETYGIIVYQEQVMQIAQKLAGYSLGEGDVLRRAMGKKDAQEMASQREKFVSGAVRNEIDEALAGRIFDKMEKFAAYGFNKSHAAAYGFVGYVTAYLKANYPREWMAALMTCDRGDLTKVAKFLRECQEMDIKILPPDVNEADTEFVATTGGIRFAMNGIKGVGEGVVRAIVEERRKTGPFSSLFDFLSRIDLKKLSKKAVETLSEAGAFDFTGWKRGALKEGVEPMWEYVQSRQKEKNQGIMTLFSEDESRFLKAPVGTKEPTMAEKLIKEKELLGFFLTGHPMDSFQDQLKNIGAISLHQLEELDDKAVARVAFILETLEVKLAHKTQRKFAIAQISDGMSYFEMPLWSDLFEPKAHELKENELFFAVVQVDKREGFELSCRWLSPLATLDEAVLREADKAYDAAKMRSTKFYPKRETKVEKAPAASTALKVQVTLPGSSLSTMLDLKKIFRSFPGQAKVYLEFKHESRLVAEIEINEPWGVMVSPELKSRLESLKGVKVIA